MSEAKAVYKKFPVEVWVERTELSVCRMPHFDLSLQHETRSLTHHYYQLILDPLV